MTRAAINVNKPRNRIFQSDSSDINGRKMNVGFGRFIVQSLQAIWEGVHTCRSAFRGSSQGIATKAQLDAGADGRRVGDRSQLHFGHGTGQEKRLPANSRGGGSGIRDRNGSATHAD